MVVSSIASGLARTVAIAGLEGVSRSTLSFSENEELVYDLEGITIRVPLHQDRLLMVGLVSASMFTLGVQYSIRKASLRFEAYITAKTAGRAGQAAIELRAARTHLIQAERNVRKSQRIAGVASLASRNVAIADRLGFIADTAKGLNAVDDAKDIQRLNILRDRLQQKAAVSLASEQAATRAAGWKATGRIGGRLLSIVGWADLGILLITGAVDLFVSEQAEQDLLGFDIRPFSPLDEYVLSPAIDAIWGETPEVIKETIQSTIDSLIDEETLEAAQLALLWWFIDEEHISIEGEWPIYLPAKYATITLIDDISEFMAQPILLLQTGFMLILVKILAKQMLTLGLTIINSRNGRGGP